MFSPLALLMMVFVMSLLAMVLGVILVAQGSLPRFAQVILLGAMVVATVLSLWLLLKN